MVSEHKGKQSTKDLPVYDPFDYDNDDLLDEPKEDLSPNSKVHHLTIKESDSRIHQDSSVDEQLVEDQNPNTTVEEIVQDPSPLHFQMAEKKRDRTDPLYLHGGESSSTVLTSTVLTRLNYFEWSTSVQLGLLAKMKTGFIDGSCKMPSDNKEAILWRMVDATVRTWIMNTIDKKNKVHFQSTLTSQQLWDEIKARYEGNNGPTQYQLRKNIYTIQQETALVIEVTYIHVLDVN
ncbi:uncharacterized protein LOC124935247 [Impatiens glandulifera]|uniref:uncharacterized protein LOC124935247 n=1 Tax=Impatiens glandulifera TaxID=253017 RepID=UPI001FB15EE5|nr:uncharacterized protein LOC124935247 [Impatiens glandulifera]